MFALVELHKNSPKYCNNITTFSDEDAYLQEKIADDIKYSLEYHINKKTSMYLLYLPENSNYFQIDIKERILGGILIQKIEF